MDEMKLPPISKKLSPKMVLAKPESERAPQPAVIKPKPEPKLEPKVVVEDIPAFLPPPKIVIEDTPPSSPPASVPAVEQTEPLLLPQTLMEMEAGRRALERYNPVLPKK